MEEKITLYNEKGEKMGYFVPSEPEPVKTGWEKSKDDNGYYFIDVNGRVERNIAIGSEIDNELYECANRFSSRELAEKESKRRTLDARMRRWADKHNQGWTPDWEDNSMGKWQIYYLIAQNMFTTNYVCGRYAFDKIYFKTEEIAEQAIEVFGNEIREVMELGRN